MPQSVRGGNVTAISSIAAFHLQGAQKQAFAMEAAMRELYGSDGMLTGAATQTFQVLEEIEAKLKPDYLPAHAAIYPETHFGRSLFEIAQLSKADLGLEVACTDLGGWDTHADQGAGKGEQAGLLSELALSLQAFVTDMQGRMNRVSIVVMSEFGRRVEENGSGGTDHGHGNVMFVVGGGVNGKQVYADWPGLHPDQRYGPGDLQVTTDFRQVLGEVVGKRLANPNVEQVFPDFSEAKLGLLRMA